MLLCCKFWHALPVPIVKQCTIIHRDLFWCSCKWNSTFSFKFCKKNENVRNKLTQPFQYQKYCIVNPLQYQITAERTHNSFPLGSQQGWCSATKVNGRALLFALGDDDMQWNWIKRKSAGVNEGGVSVAITHSMLGSTYYAAIWIALLKSSNDKIWG